MSDDQFTKLFKYMQAEFKKLHAELELKADRKQLDSLYALVDKMFKQQETDEQERLAMNRQLDRHEHWITRASPRVGVHYKP